MIFFSAQSIAEFNGKLSGSITGATDYIWRGYSKSDGKPVAQGNIDYEFKSGIFLGSSLSTINFADYGYDNRSTLEFRPYLGFAYQLSSFWQQLFLWRISCRNGQCSSIGNTHIVGACRANLYSAKCSTASRSSAKKHLLVLLS